MTDSARGPYLIRLTPNTGVVRNSLLSLLLISVPIFGTLFFLGLPHGSWPIAIVGEALSLAAYGVGYALYRTTFIGVTATSIEERGFWGSRTSFPRAEIASVGLANIYNNSSSDSIPQLIVRNAAGTRMLRMRGSFWSIDAMRAVVAALDVTPTLPDEVMSSEEFFDRFPGAAYWFENRPAIVIVAIVVLLIACAGVILGIMQLIGLPANLSL